MILMRLLPDRWKDRLRQRAGAATLRGRLQNLRRAGFAPRKIIDAGAFQGEWATLAHEVFPNAAILLIEPQPSVADVLMKLCMRLPSATYRQVLLGREKGRAQFLVQASNSRIVSGHFVPAPTDQLLTLPIEPLSSIADAAGFGECDLLKLDLQGHELDALVGAGAIFGQAEVIVSEVSWLCIGNVPRIDEVVSEFLAKGYRLYDIFGLNYRPRDGALWQTDLMFVRADSSLLASRSWA